MADISEVPPGATRVKVLDEVGRSVWRKPSELRPEDKFEVNTKTGEPVVMYGAPGKPSNQSALAAPVFAPPSAGAPQATISHINARKATAFSQDEVLTATKKNSDSSDVLTGVLVGLAEESASLAFERQEAERRGEPTSQISLRRVNALKAVGDTWLKKKEVMSSKGLDMESPAFKIIFGHIAETFRKACDDAGVRPEMAESIFAVFGRLVDDVDWIKEAKNKMEKGND